MKQIFFISCLVLLVAGLVHAQDKPYRVVFDLTSKDSMDQKAVMRWIKEVSAVSPKAEMEVVMYAKGFELVMPEKSTMLTEAKEAMKNPNVSFKVCQIAMKNNKIDKSQLLPEVQTVPDGIYEIISKQQDHWGYIKVSH
jgi:intracellular sulfur oxidation DsrE/DsrF family protein